MRNPRRLRLLLALLLLTSFTLLTVDSRSGGSAFSSARSAVGRVLSPVQSAVRSVTAPVGRSVSAALDSGRADRRITELERQDADLRRQLAAEQQAGDDLAALRQLQYYGFRGDFSTVGARVLARGETVGDAEQTVTVDVGSADGIAADMRVVTPVGYYVGRVRRVDGPHRSVVVLVTDRSNRVSVQLAKGKSYLTVAKGQGPGQPLAVAFSDTTRQLKVGDEFSTVDGTADGSSVAVPGGVLVGTVSRLTGISGIEQGAELTPAADVASLDVLGVLVAAPGPPRRAVLPNIPPPSPSPSPSPSPPRTGPPGPASSATSVAAPP